MSNNLSINNITYNKPRFCTVNFGNNDASATAANNRTTQDSYIQSTNTKKDNSLKSKILIGLGVIATAALAFFYFTRGKSNPSNKASLVKDVLGYEIKPPKISHLSGGKYTPQGDFPLQAEYLKILDNIKEDPKTLARYNEVIQELQLSAQKVNNKFKEIDAAADFRGGCIERAIQQKRYFSLPGNQREGYCCLDPLLYKAAREEALDIQIGYHLLNPFQNGEKPANSLLNGLRTRYGNSISKENLAFVDECINKLSDEEALCCGHESKLHAFELAKLGKIFRNAVGVEV